MGQSGYVYTLHLNEFEILLLLSIRSGINHANIFELSSIDYFKFVSAYIYIYHLVQELSKF